MKARFTDFTLVLALATLSPALWVDSPIQVVGIQDHRFTPAEIIIPANTRVKLMVKNLDPTTEEFESYELNREKIIPGGTEVIIYIGSVKPGRYPFFGEFHQNGAQVAHYLLQTDLPSDVKWLLEYEYVF